MGGSKNTLKGEEKIFKSLILGNLAKANIPPW